MPIEKYLIESVRQMHTLLVQCEVNPQRNANCLVEASALGCLTLKRLCDDPDFHDVLDEFADVRLISTFIQKQSAKQKRIERKRINEFRSIVENSDNFEMFLDLEKEVLLRGGVPAEVTELLIEASLETIEEIRARAKPPSEVMEIVRVLRDRACLVSADLKAKAIDESRWDGIKARIRKTTLGIGGAALIGLNASALAATVGITSVGSVVSAALGGAVLSGAAADIGKSRGAAG